MSIDTTLETLLCAVDDILNEATWFLETDMGTAEMLVSTSSIDKLRSAYEDYENAEQIAEGDETGRE